MEWYVVYFLDEDKKLKEVEIEANCIVNAISQHIADRMESTGFKRVDVFKDIKCVSVKSFVTGRFTIVGI